MLSLSNDMPLKRHAYQGGDLRLELSQTCRLPLLHDYVGLQRVNGGVFLGVGCAVPATGTPADEKADAPEVMTCAYGRAQNCALPALIYAAGSRAALPARCDSPGSQD